MLRLARGISAFAGDARATLSGTAMDRAPPPPPPPLATIQETNFGGSSTNLVGPPRKRSLAQMTREALPRMDNYRNLMSVAAVQRPTIGELYEGVEEEKVSTG